MNMVTAQDGTRIAFDRVGDGPPLIVVGGAFSYRRWKGLLQLAALLEERFTVINYDRRGRGDSGDTAPYAVEREIEDLAALVEAAGGRAFVWASRREECSPSARRPTACRSPSSPSTSLRSSSTGTASCLRPSSGPASTS
jgi:Alpha/beta hydrolase family